MGGMQMIAAVYSVLVVTSFVCAAATGNLGSLSAGLFDGVERSVGLVCSLVGTMSIWGGVLSALDSAGAVTLLSRAFSPVIRLFLPCASRDSESVRAISMSMAANLLGMGNAATPFALTAVEKIEGISGETEKAKERDIITFSVISCTPVCLIPANVTALRSLYSSSSPGAVILPAAICAGICFLLSGSLSLLIGRLSFGSCRGKIRGSPGSCTEKIGKVDSHG